MPAPVIKFNDSVFPPALALQCFWDSITSKNDHVIFVCRLNAYLLFDAQPTRWSNCQASRPALSHHIFRALSLCRYICVHFISFYFSLFQLDRVCQLSSMATDSKEPNQLFDCIFRANIYAKREPQQTTSAHKRNKKKKKKKKKRIIWIQFHIDMQAFGRGLLFVSHIFIRVVCFVVTVALHRFNFPLKSIWKWKILLVVGAAVYYFCCLFHSISLHLWV